MQDPEITPGTPQYKAKIDEWHGYVPELLTAIELGYLDIDLKKVAKACRERYYVVNQDEVPMNALRSSSFDPNTVPILGEGGLLAHPVVWNYQEPAATAGHFRAFGHMYAKSHLVGKLIRMANYKNGMVPNGSICRIEKVNKTAFLFSVVWCPTDAPAAAVRVAMAKNDWPGVIEFHARLFER